MRIYRTNQQAHQIEEPAENMLPEETAVAPVLQEEAVQGEGIWQRCPSCASVLYADDLAANLHVCPGCGHHFRLSAKKRIEYTVDEGTFQEFNARLIGKNPLDFPGYDKKLEKLREDTGLNEGWRYSFMH